MSLCNAFIYCPHTVFNRSLLAVRWGMDWASSRAGFGLLLSFLRPDQDYESSAWGWMWGWEAQRDEALSPVLISPWNSWPAQRCLSEEADCQRGGSSPRPRVFRRLDSNIPKIERESVILYHAVAPEWEECRKRSCAFWDPDKGISTSCAMDSIHLCNIRLGSESDNLTASPCGIVFGSTSQEKELRLAGWRCRRTRVGETTIVIHNRKMNVFLLRHIFIFWIMTSRAFATPTNVLFQCFTGNS